MYLIYDTETTGFYNPKVEATSPQQARICSLAAVLLNEQLEEVEHMHTLIKPSGYWNMGSGAFAKHGISKERCEQEGLPLKEVIEKFISMEIQSSYRLAYNIEFDDNMMSVELAQTTCNIICKFVQPICIMEACTPICRLPYKNGRRNYGREFKWPKLEEAYNHFFNEPLTNAHDALADVRATARIFKHLVTEKLIDINNQTKEETNARE